MKTISNFLNNLKQINKHSSKQKQVIKEPIILKDVEIDKITIIEIVKSNPNLEQNLINPNSTIR